MRFRRRWGRGRHHGCQPPRDGTGCQPQAAQLDQRGGQPEARSRSGRRTGEIDAGGPAQRAGAGVVRSGRDGPRPLPRFPHRQPVVGPAARLRREHAVQHRRRGLGSRPSAEAEGIVVPLRDDDLRRQHERGLLPLAGRRQQVRLPGHLQHQGRRHLGRDLRTEAPRQPAGHRARPDTSRQVLCPAGMPVDRQLLPGRAVLQRRVHLAAVFRLGARTPATR